MGGEVVVEEIGEFLVLNRIIDGFVNIYQIKDQGYLLVNLTPSDVFRILPI